MEAMMTYRLNASLCCMTVFWNRNSSRSKSPADDLLAQSAEIATSYQAKKELRFPRSFSWQMVLDLSGKKILR